MRERRGGMERREMALLLNLNTDSYVSQFTVEAYCFADGRCLFKQPWSAIYHWNLYDEEISKKCRFVCLSVRPSVRPFVTLKKPTSLSLLSVE